MSCFNLTGKPQTTRQAADGKRKAIEAAKARAERIAAVERARREGGRQWRPMPVPRRSELTVRPSMRGRTNCHSRVGPRDTDAATAAERSAWTEEQQAARESVLDNARFRTARHRRIYRLHVAGITAREIGRRVQMHPRHVEHTIAVYDRQQHKDTARRLTLDQSTAASWRRYTCCHERASDWPAIGRVLRLVRELPAETPTPAHVTALPRAFRARWRAAGLSEASTPDDVLKAAQTWPELAEHLRLAGLLADPFADAAKLPTPRIGFLLAEDQPYLQTRGNSVTGKKWRFGKKISSEGATQ